MCREKVHQSRACHYANQFAPKIKKQKKDHSHKTARTDENDSDYSMMLRNFSPPSEDSILLSHHSAALDSGCSSHTLKESDVQSTARINSEHQSVIQTAHSGTTISTLGRADAGLCRKSLVVKDGDLVLSLISVSRLDGDGYYMTFGGKQGGSYQERKNFSDCIFVLQRFIQI